MTATTDAGLELASMNEICPCDCHLQQDAYNHSEDVCPHCKGTCRVPRFPGVRVPCGCPKSIDGRSNWVSPCPVKCQGRGWTVSDDFMVWMRTVPDDVELLFWHQGDDWFFDYKDFDNKVYVEAAGKTPLEALRQALLKAAA